VTDIKLFGIADQGIAGQYNGLVARDSAALKTALQYAVRIDCVFQLV